MSPGELTAVETPSGRVLALTPHPERVVTLENNSSYPPDMKEDMGWVPDFGCFRTLDSGVVEA